MGGQLCTSKAYDDMKPKCYKCSRNLMTTWGEENEYNLNIPLYVEKIIEDNSPSVEGAMVDLKLAWRASLEAEEKFKNILKEFMWCR